MEGPGERRGRPPWLKRGSGGGPWYMSTIKGWAVRASNERNRKTCSLTRGSGSRQCTDFPSTLLPSNLVSKVIVAELDPFVHTTLIVSTDKSKPWTLGVVRTGSLRSPKDLLPRPLSVFSLPTCLFTVTDPSVIPETECFRTGSFIWSCCTLFTLLGLFSR